VILTGKSGWSGCPSPLLASFSGNSDYVTWSFDCDIDVYRDTGGEAGRREREVNAIYDGHAADPVSFLHAHHIAAVVIWPDEEIANAVVERLKQQLAPSYVYLDVRPEDAPQSPSAGVFLLQKTAP
jgi:hypothetical protein